MTTDLSDSFFEVPEPAGNHDPHKGFGVRSSKIRVIKVLRAKSQADPKGLYVNCTVSGHEGEKQLSPFTLGPCVLYGGKISKRMENGWQFSKVYAEHVGADGNPTQEYFEWAAAGWKSWRAERHPMGKGVRAAFHWWDGQKLDKLTARKRIYAPLYAEQVVKRPFFQELKSSFEQIRQDDTLTLYLMDHDAYPYKSMTLTQILNNSAKSMGHGFVLAMLLTNDAALQECECR